MTLPLLGAALTLDSLEGLGPWIREGGGRALEIQDFVAPGVIAGDCDAAIDAWRAALDGHDGPRGIHGPFFGLDISSPDRDIRAVVQRRLLRGIEIAEALGATHMVVHSPFTCWHALNYANYGRLRADLFEASADCLGPVLARAADAGCTVMLENIDDADPRDRTDLVAGIDHPNLMVSLDTGHAELAHGRYGAPPVVDFVTASAGRIGHVHLQDADGYADRHWHPGEGRLPWAPIFAALAEVAPAARLILEVKDRHRLLPETVRRLERLGLAS